MTYEQILQIFKQNGNKDLECFNNKIVNSGVPKIGCKIPFVRGIAKLCKLEEIESFPLHAYYEVDLLRGIVTANCKLPFAEKVPHISAFADTIENWAVCDCSTIKVPVSERRLYYDFFCNMLPCEKPFVCRYGVVNLMTNFLDAEHIDNVFLQLKRVADWGNYYVNMGVAWLLATAMAKCREATKLFMEGEALQTVSKFAYNKALQKMRESFRVNDADKEWTRTLKRS